MVHARKGVAARNRGIGAKYSRWSLRPLVEENAQLLNQYDKKVHILVQPGSSKSKPATKIMHPSKQRHLRTTKLLNFIFKKIKIDHFFLIFFFNLKFCNFFFGKLSALFKTLNFLRNKIFYKNKMQESDNIN